ncbi:unnamed protein product [Orchesella dallaii]|uniref:Uncharacterized protein n=1 Tax=Orchesella dallaii TaxID=48710 RepID=A0ABP1PIN9_9HEXA
MAKKHSPLPKAQPPSTPPNVPVPPPPPPKLDPPVALVLSTPAPKVLQEKFASPSLTSVEKWLARFTNSGYYTLCLPVHFDFAKGLLQITNNTRIKLIWQFRLAWLVIDNLYLICVGHKVTLKTVGEKEFSDFWMHTISRIIGCAVSLLMALEVDATVEVINAMIATRRIWRKKFGVWSEEFTGPLELFLRRTIQLAAFFGSLQSIFPLVMHIQGRHSARYWGSQLIPISLYDSPIGIVLAAANDFLLSQAAIINAVFGILVVVSFFVLMRFWTTSITSKVEELGMRSRIPLMQYRSLLMLNRIYNSSFGQKVSPGNLVLGSVLLVLVLYLTLEGAGKMLRRSLHLKRVLKMKGSNQGKEIENESIRNIFRVKHTVACMSVVPNRYLLKRNRYDTFVKIDDQFQIQMNFKRTPIEKSVQATLMSPIFLTFIFLLLPNATSTDFVLGDNNITTTSVKFIVHNQQKSINSILLNLASCVTNCDDDDGICYPVSIKLKRIESNITLNGITQQWYKYNSNWLKYVTNPFIKRVGNKPCDKIRSLSKGKFDPRYRGFPGESCIKLIIDRYHNCTTPNCDSFVNEIIEFKGIALRNHDTLIYVSNVGNSYIGYRYTFFTPFPSFEGINIGSLLHPISLTWWIIIGLCVAATSLTLHHLRVKKSVWTVVQIILEQGFDVDRITYKHAWVLASFIMGGILIRAVYTSTLYSFITEVPLPKIPKSLNETLENTSIDILVDTGSLQLITKPVSHMEVKDNVVPKIPKLVKRNAVLWTCLLGISSFRPSHVKLYQNISKGIPINCVLNSNRRNKRNFETRKPLRRFALLATPESFQGNAIALFGNRMVFSNLEPDIMVDLHGFVSSRKHTFHEFLTNDIGRLEATGIFGMLKEASINMEKVLRLRKEMEKLPLQRFINVYSAINCKNCQNLDNVNNDGGNDQLSQLESLRVVWFIFFVCITIACTIMFMEIVLTMMILGSLN